MTSTGLIGAGLLLLLGLVAVLFRGGGRRLRAALALVPLLGLAVALVWAGRRERTEALAVASNPTVFGDGSHAPGASHATQRTPGADSGAPAKARAANTERTPQAMLQQAQSTPGWEWPDKGERHTAATLWERIDGAAERYKRLGVVSAVFATAARDGSEVELQLFDMGDARGAAAIFQQTDRDPDARPLTGVGEAAVLWRGGGELQCGRVYVRLVLSVEETPQNADLAAALAKRLCPKAQPLNADGLMARLAKLEGLEWPQKAQAYNRQTLWERIDGGAERFLKLGFRGARFATARVDGADLEVQLFEMSGEQAAVELLKEPRVDWEGGGEARRGAFYLKVLVSSDRDSPAIKAAPGRILGAFQGDSAGADRPDESAPAAADGTANVDVGEAEHTAAETATTDELGEGPGGNLDPALVKRYGLALIRDEGEAPGPRLRIIRCRDAFAAAEWAVSHVPEDGAAQIRRGEFVVWTRGDHAQERAEKAARALRPTPIVGAKALKGAETITPRATGWGGREALGPTLVARYKDDSEVFLAAPKAPDAAMKALRESYPGWAALPGGLVSASDLDQGDVIFGAKKGRIVGIAGFENRARAIARLRRILADL